jgi:peptidyl-prolyl cis-trans isomerase-like protein 2
MFVYRFHFLIHLLNIYSGNISPYSSGLAGASLTSTSVDISEASSSKLLWDEVRFYYVGWSYVKANRGHRKR